MQVIEVGPDSERTGAAINRAVGEALQSCSLRQVRWRLLAPAKWQSCACAACLGCTAQTAIQLVRQPEPILMALLGSPAMLRHSHQLSLSLACSSAHPSVH